MTIEVYNHQEAESLSDGLIERFTSSLVKALPLVLKDRIQGRGILTESLEVEISIVDDPTIAQVHVDFMDIPGATDVITFSHGDSGGGAMGEIVVSAETARSNSSEYDQEFESELMLYMIHGLLHLAGHEDADPDERSAMEEIQFRILKEVW